MYNLIYCLCKWIPAADCVIGQVELSQTAPHNDFDVNGVYSVAASPLWFHKP